MDTTPSTIHRIRKCNEFKIQIQPAQMFGRPKRRCQMMQYVRAATTSWTFFICFGNYEYVCPCRRVTESETSEYMLNSMRLVVNTCNLCRVHSQIKKFVFCVFRRWAKVRPLRQSLLASVARAIVGNRSKFSMTIIRHNYIFVDGNVQWLDSQRNDTREWCKQNAIS